MSQKRTLDIDFVAPHSLEDCAYRLGRLDDRRSVPFSPPFSVRLTHLDENTCAFLLNENSPAPVMIRGYLNYLHDRATYVSGVAIIKRHPLYRDTLVGLGLILALVVVVSELMLVVYLPIFAFFMLRYRAGITRERERLVRLVGDTLVR